MDRQDQTKEEQLMSSSSAVNTSSNGDIRINVTEHSEAGKNRKKKKKRRCCWKQPCHLTVVGRYILSLTFLIIWLVCGMIVFFQIEHPAELVRIEEEHARNNAMAKLMNESFITTVTFENGVNAAPSIRAIFARFLPQYEIVNLTNTTLTVRLNVTNNTSLKKPLPKWDLSGSLFFCIATVTTIGYGNLSPSTYVGRVCLLAFAAIGIPLMMIVVGNNVKLLTMFAHYLNRHTRRFASAVRNASSDGDLSNNSRRSTAVDDRRIISKRRRHELNRRRLATLTSQLIFSTIGVIVFILLPSVLFSYYEEWDYITACYFSFVSLATIGFGDYVAGQEQDVFYRGYRLFLCLWIFAGMAFIGTFNATIQSLIDKMTKDSVTKIGTSVSKVRRLSLATLHLGGSRLSIFGSSKANSDSESGSEIRRVGERFDTTCRQIINEADEDALALPEGCRYDPSASSGGNSGGGSSTAKPDDYVRRKPSLKRLRSVSASNVTDLDRIARQNEILEGIRRVKAWSTHSGLDALGKRYSDPVIILKHGDDDDDTTVLDERFQDEEGEQEISNHTSAGGETFLIMVVADERLLENVAQKMRRNRSADDKFYNMVRPRCRLVMRHQSDPQVSPADFRLSENEGDI